MKQPRRLVGTENGVRVDAEIIGDSLSPNVSVPLRYDITNGRSTTILVADLLPQASYDPETRTVTVAIGSEIPGQEFLPRLIAIPPGEKKTFTTGVHVVLRPTRATPWQAPPGLLRLRVNFLGDTRSFEPLIDIPEKAVHDPQLADQLFTKWVELNEVVFTNALPMRWSTSNDEPLSAEPGRRRRASLVQRLPRSS